MERWLSVVALALTVAVLVPAAAHALEWPGKRRLVERDYRIVQGIYYPGFTVLGALEIPALLVCLAAAFLTPAGRGMAFGLRVAAVAALVLMVAIYWIRVHPVNRVWVEGLADRGAPGRFFAAGAAPDSLTSWTVLRDRWETGHGVRAVLAVLAFAAQLIAFV